MNTQWLLFFIFPLLPGTTKTTEQKFSLQTSSKYKSLTHDVITSINWPRSASSCTAELECNRVPARWNGTTRIYERRRFRTMHPQTLKNYTPHLFVLWIAFFMISGINCGRPTNLSSRVGFSSSLATRICIAGRQDGGTCMQSTRRNRDLPVSCYLEILPSTAKFVNVIKCFLIYSCPIKVEAFGSDLWLDC